MNCKTINDLREALTGVRGDMTTGEAILLPALETGPPRAQFLIYEGSSRQGATTWLPPHELVVLDPYSAALLTHRPVTPEELGVRAHHSGVPIPFAKGGPRSKDFFESLSVFEALQPAVWDRFLTGRATTDDELRDTVRFASAWRALVRADQRPYYDALSPVYEAWLAAQGARDGARTPPGY